MSFFLQTYFGLSPDHAFCKLIANGCLDVMEAIPRKNIRQERVPYLPNIYLFEVFLASLNEPAEASKPGIDRKDTDQIKAGGFADFTKAMYSMWTCVLLGRKTHQSASPKR